MAQDYVEILEYEDKNVLGTKEYWELVYDDSPAYEVDMHAIARYSGMWYEVRATGCSCWGGEWFVGSGPYASLDLLREEMEKEYANPYYKDVLQAWRQALDKASETVV